MKILFVCLYGEVRSPTGAKVFSERARQESLDIVTHYTGIIAGNEKQLSQIHIDDSDLVIAVHSEVASRMQQEFNLAGKLAIKTNIDDIYKFNQQELIEIFHELYAMLRQDNIL